MSTLLPVESLHRTCTGNALYTALRLPRRDPVSYRTPCSTCVNARHLMGCLQGHPVCGTLPWLPGDHNNTDTNTAKQTQKSLQPTTTVQENIEAQTIEQTITPDKDNTPSSPPPKNNTKTRTPECYKFTPVVWLLNYGERISMSMLAFISSSFSIESVCPHSFAVRNNSLDSMSLNYRSFNSIRELTRELCSRYFILAPQAIQ